MSPRLVVITESEAEHRFVANRICREFDVAAILVTDPVPGRSWKKVIRKSVFEFADKALWRLFLAATGDREKRRRDVEAVLGRENCAEFHESSKVIAVGRPKGGRLRAEVERLDPDYIAIYGTGIVPNSVLGKARKRALNMHTGISPYYRGTACAFWPIYEGEPEWIGATVHECVPAVDGGEIYSTARASLRRGDSLHAVFARAVLVGADAYVDVLRQATSGRLNGVPQDLTVGREYRGYMRGLRSELIARWQLRKLNRTWPA
jgi:methionyl-tRNA formyltransferase